MRICCVCGARPNVMKIAPIVRALAAHDEFEPYLVHTGQHYDPDMVPFEDLDLAAPGINLNVGSGSHASQTARIMQRFEPILLKQSPDLVIVVGDVNSTLACALVASKLLVPVAHVESGLRSFDRSMPEEINRMLTDMLSELLFVSEMSGVHNLRREGVDDQRIHFVGNVMIDSLLHNRARAEASDVLSRLQLSPRSYGVLTLHRSSNVDCRGSLVGLIEALDVIQRDLPIVFPMHPRTSECVARHGLREALAALPGVVCAPPLRYLDFIKLAGHARVVLTDSGGIQEECTVLQVPCLTLREQTERPATLDAGWNRLVGVDPARITSACASIVNGSQPAGTTPPLWDGRAAERIAACLKTWRAGRSESAASAEMRGVTTCEVRVRKALELVGSGG